MRGRPRSRKPEAFHRPTKGGSWHDNREKGPIWGDKVPLNRGSVVAPHLTDKPNRIGTIHDQGHFKPDLFLPRRLTLPGRASPGRLSLPSQTRPRGHAHPSQVCPCRSDFSSQGSPLRSDLTNPISPRHPDNPTLVLSNLPAPKDEPYLSRAPRRTSQYNPSPRDCSRRTLSCLATIRGSSDRPPRTSITSPGSPEPHDRPHQTLPVRRTCLAASRRHTPQDNPCLAGPCPMTNPTTTNPPAPTDKPRQPRSARTIPRQGPRTSHASPVPREPFPARMTHLSLSFQGDSPSLSRGTNHVDPARCHQTDHPSTKLARRRTLPCLTRRYDSPCLGDPKDRPNYSHPHPADDPGLAQASPVQTWGTCPAFPAPGPAARTFLAIASQRTNRTSPTPDERTNHPASVPASRTPWDKPFLTLPRDRSVRTKPPSPRAGRIPALACTSASCDITHSWRPTP
jgi:hypothetical protein